MTFCLSSAISFCRGLGGILLIQVFEHPDAGYFGVQPLFLPLVRALLYPDGFSKCNLLSFIRLQLRQLMHGFPRPILDFSRLFVDSINDILAT